MISTILILFALSQSESECRVTGERFVNVDGVNQCVQNWRETSELVDYFQTECRRVTMTAATFGCNGITVPTMTCTPTSSPSDSGSFVTVTTSTTINTPCGHNSAVGQTRPAYRPIYRAMARTDSAVTNRRVWHGLTESALAGVAVVNSSTASTVDFVAVGFDTAVNANWKVRSGDGTNYTCLDSGVAVNASTNYNIEIDWSVAGRLDVTINSTRIRKTTNLSTASVNLGIQNSVNNNDAAARAHLIGPFFLRQRF